MDQLKALDEAAMQKGMFKHLKESNDRAARWKNLTGKRSRYDTHPGITKESGMPDLERRKLEVMLDNTAAWSHTNEAAEAGVGIINEEVLSFLRGEIKENATVTGNISTFATVAFPLIRRVYPNLISNFLVAIQPIPLPVALLFFLDFKFGTNFAPVARGDRLDDRTIVGGRTRYHRAREYSSGRISGEAVGAGDAATVVFFLAFFPIASGSLVVNVDGVPTAVTADLETGRIEFSGAPAGGTAITADYSLVFEGTGPIPEIELDMSSDSVTAESKKLKARWSIEAAQDAAVFHGMDIDAELLNTMAEQITREIDSMVIQDLLTAAATGAGNVNFSTTVGAGYSPIEWERTFLNAFIDAGQLIHARRLRYPNWIVGGDDIIVRFTKMAGFNPNIGITPGGGPAGTFDTFNTPVVNGQGPAFIGTLNTRYAIFHDPVHLPAGQALVGYRGNSMLDTGYIFSPYQPLFITPALIDPNDMTPRRGVMTRFARKTVSGDFYATVTIT